MALRVFQGSDPSHSLTKSLYSTDLSLGYHLPFRFAIPSQISYFNRSIHHESYNHEKLSRTDKMIVVYGIACAIRFLHDIGLFHGAVCPESIYLDCRNYPRLCFLPLSQNIDRRATELEAGKTRDLLGFGQILTLIVKDAKWKKDLRNDYDFGFVLK
jgi:serine/threonine protein kinase